MTDRQPDRTPLDIANVTPPPVIDGVRFLQVWNEPDPAVRRGLVEELWAPQGRNLTATITAVGHDQIVERVTRSYDRFVGSGEHRFEADGPVQGHHDAAMVPWAMVRRADGVAVAHGEEVLLLDGAGRILVDHQFTR